MKQKKSTTSLRMLYIYNVIIQVYGFIIHLASLWNNSARAWIAGRKGNLKSLKNWKHQRAKQVVWFHAASHGEYEQGLPLIQMIKRRNPYFDIAITFYSPSGYNAVNNSKYGDWIGYIPLDTKSKMQQFIGIMDPTIVIVVKNELWWNSLAILKNSKIPVHYISSTIRVDHYFIKYKLSVFQRLINNIGSIGLVDNETMQILKQSYPLANTYESGDMRVDRVSDISIKNAEDQVINFPKDKDLIIYGSVWPSDLNAIILMMERYPEHLHILFPHKLDINTIEYFESNIKNIETFENKAISTNIGIVNKMGILAHSYRYADVVYIGGGYGDGIHNILEAAVYRKPILIGPNHEKSQEACTLKNSNVITVLPRKPTIANIPIFSLQDRLQIENELDIYFNQHEGATEVTYNHIFGESNM